VGGPGARDRKETLQRSARISEAQGRIEATAVTSVLARREIPSDGFGRFVSGPKIRIVPGSQVVDSTRPIFTGSDAQYHMIVGNCYKGASEVMVLAPVFPTTTFRDHEGYASSRSDEPTPQQPAHRERLKKARHSKRQSLLFPSLMTDSFESRLRVHGSTYNPLRTSDRNASTSP
jgi:hypothetical protein